MNILTAYLNTQLLTTIKLWATMKKRRMHATCTRRRPTYGVSACYCSADTTRCYTRSRHAWYTTQSAHLLTVGNFKSRHEAELKPVLV